MRRDPEHRGRDALVVGPLDDRDQVVRTLGPIDLLQLDTRALPDLRLVIDTLGCALELAIPCSVQFTSTM
jgi:hypothetical protein